MTAHHPISNATDSPLPMGEGLGARPITLSAAGVEMPERLKTGMHMNQSGNGEI
jgi:hypothetical protein